MTRRSLSTWIAALALIALADAADAQNSTRKSPPASSRRSPPPRRPPSGPVPLRADAISPEVGRPGERVTITGRGFTSTTSVVVGGVGARVLSASPRQLVFEVPPISGDSAVALRKPGRTDVVAGTFHLSVKPVILRMVPSSGAPGARVEIIGRGFERRDTVIMSGQPVAVAEWSRERLVVLVPDGARTDHLELARPSGERARSPQRFRVVPQRPEIARVNPDSGPPGTRVRITGSGFTPRDRVLYGSIATPVLGRGSSWVDVEVPRRAPRSQHFQVRGAAGAGKSPQPFALIVPQSVRSFSPRRGPPGTQVEIRGDHFRDGDWVALAGKRLPVTHLSERRIAVTIPVGSPSGALTVGRERHQSSAVGRFEVLNPPTLTAFTPTRGEPGTAVTLQGTHLDRAEVYYGRERIPVRVRRAGTSLVVAIPRAARDDRFRVTTAAGSAQSQQAFQVQYHTVIEDVTPRAGVPGTTLVLRGRHMDKADEFAIGSARLELVRRDNKSATFRVPADARTAPVTWMTYGRRDQTPWRFDVLAAPIISQFQPTSGAAGAEIIIRGDHIDRETEVFFGRRKLRVVRLRAPHEIAVQLPRNAGGADYLYLEGRGARTRSEEKFEVRTAPVILSAQPSSARAGAPVLVRGRWFTDATEILIGKQRARVLRRDLAGGSILIEIPRGLPAGSHTMSARGDGMMSERDRAFMVTPGSPRVSKD